MTYTAKQLAKMKLRELEAVGRDLGLKFNKSHNRAERAKRIIAEQALRAAASETPPDDPTPPQTTQRPPAPSFDRLTEGDDTPAADDSAGGDARGGKREGAGRKPGSTDEICRMKALSQQPHPVVTSTLEFLFARWAASVGCDQVALTKEEAFPLALAWTQIGDYVGVTDRIPVWLQLAVTATWTTANIVASKAQIARQFREAQEADQQEAVQEVAA